MLYLYINYTNVSHLVRRIMDAEENHKKIKKTLLRFFIFCWFLGMWPISCPPSPLISSTPQPPPPQPFSSNHGQRKRPLFFVPGQIGKNHNEQVREKMKKGTNEWMNEAFKHPLTHSLTQSLNQWIKGLDDSTDERTNEWMDFRKNRWMKRRWKSELRLEWMGIPFLFLTHEWLSGRDPS